MISEKLQAAINTQIINEWWSGFLYKSMQAYFASDDFPGLANWFGVQAQEELAHGEILFRYVHDVGGRVTLSGVEPPKGDFASAREALEYGLWHEKKVTALIGQLLETAREERDHGAEIMLQWFVTEQIEEEASFSLLLKKIKMVEGDGRGMLLVDQEAATRVFSLPSPLAPKV